MDDNDPPIEAQQAEQKPSGIVMLANIAPALLTPHR